MAHSNKAIINHIPKFIECCKQKGFSENTLNNYQRYLKCFTVWLQKNNLSDLKPHDFSSKNIKDYQLFLSNRSGTSKVLKKTTQNYYLIALRALLGYFSSKNIDSFAYTEISLLKVFKDNNTVRRLTEVELKKLLSFPDTKNEVGLRDKAILETLATSGLKVKQLTGLSRDFQENQDYYLSNNSLFWIRKYLNNRKDEESPLFINYKSSKGAEKRLTSRSIERITTKYGELADLKFSLTPEILRWSSFDIALKQYNNPDPINNIYTHISVVSDTYEPKISSEDNKKSVFKSDKWHIAEKFISEEQEWLRKNLSFLPNGYGKNYFDQTYCNSCILRKIAIMIVGGKIRARKIKLKNCWELNKNYGQQNKIYHGKQWHRKMMNLISNHFKKLGYKINIEPITNYGRADLGITLNNKNLIFIEVGTVLPLKLWYNLFTMKDIIFLLAPDEKYILEFKS